MTVLRRSGGQIALLALSMIGIAISIYLTATHYEHAPVVCSNSGLVNCELVLSSIYSVVPGTAIPISVPGLLWFFVSAALACGAWFIWPGRRLLQYAQLAWGALGLLTILYLVYVEIVRLRTICLWCTSLHIIIFIIFLITLFLTQQPAADTYDTQEEVQTVPGKNR